MIHISEYGLDTFEYKITKILGDSAKKSVIKGLDNDSSVHLHLIPNITCYGERVQDIDLIVAFYDGRDKSKMHKIIDSSSNKEIYLKSFFVLLKLNSIRMKT